MKSNLSSTYKKTVAFLALIFIVFASNVLQAQFYSGSQTDFGKNRVKYEDYFWTYYSYDRYDVYFYEQGKDIANYVSKSAKTELDKVEKLFDYSFDEKQPRLPLAKNLTFSCRLLVTIV